MPYSATIGSVRHQFADLREVLAKASPARSGDALAGVAARSEEERVAAQLALADVRLTDFLVADFAPYEDDEVTRLIIDSHDAAAFAPVATMTVGELRDWLLSYDADARAIQGVGPGLTPEMVAGVSKLMRNRDLIQVASRTEVITAFRSTLGGKGVMGTRLQPNHPTDDPRGVVASIIDGLMYGCGDATIGINPATDSPQATIALLEMIDEVRQAYDIPTQSCVLSHVTTTIECIERGAPVDLVFQSIAGTQAANSGFGITIELLAQAQEAALSLKRGTVGDDVMYFETGQGSALSAGAHHGMDMQTVETRAYAIARHFKPLLVNTVVGFLGPEYLYDGKQIHRAGLEDHFCAKVLGVPMGCDVCYTNHAEADQDDMDTLLTSLGAAGCSFFITVPGSDDVMLGYQSASYHDALYVREVLGTRPAPEFEAWLQRMGMVAGEKIREVPVGQHPVSGLLGAAGAEAA